MSVGIQIIGDVHSSFIELISLLLKLGYERHTVFVGDLVDRNQYPVEVLKHVMGMVRMGKATLVRSNHDDKLRRYLRDTLILGVESSVKVGESLLKTITAVNAEPLEWRLALYHFLDNLPYTYETYLDGCGKVIVCHAAYKLTPKLKSFQQFCMYGETEGEKDEDGYPIRTYKWREGIPRHTTVVTGHDIVDYPQKHENYLGGVHFLIDTGAYKSGKLSALRLPEGEIVQND